MRPSDVPQAAVDVAQDVSARWGRDMSMTYVKQRHMLAAAAPHLIDDAMIERAARTIWDECWPSADECDGWEAMVAKGGEPMIVQSVRADAARILRAALGEVDGDA